jgi:hypothetical protein
MDLKFSILLSRELAALEAASIAAMRTALAAGIARFAAARTVRSSIQLTWK